MQSLIFHHLHGHQFLRAGIFFPVPSLCSSAIFVMYDVDGFCKRADKHIYYNYVSLTLEFRMRSFRQ